MANYQEFVNEYRLGLSKNMNNYTAKDNYPDYSRHQCTVSKYLTLEMYERLFTKVTPNGITLDKCIQPSYETGSDIIGLVAGDEESFEVFSEIFNAVINDLHKGFKATDKQPLPELDDKQLVGGELDERYVRSCRVRTGRSIRGFCLPSAISRAERRHVERILVEALSGLSNELAGVYYPLTSLTQEQEKTLIKDHFLFQKPTSKLMVNSGSVRDWPDARGIWHNEGKNFLVWINEEDHCRVISMQAGGNMRETFSRFCRGITEIERLMKDKGYEFMRNERLGFLCACPSNIGTVLRCSVHIQLKLLSKDARFKKIVAGLELDLRGTSGEDTDPVDSVYDISNLVRIKRTEREFVQQVIDGVEKLIQMEKRLENSETIDDLISIGV